MAEAVVATTTAPTFAARLHDLEPWHAAFATACARHPTAIWRQFHTFAAQPVQVRVVGDALATLVARTFAHLAEAKVDTQPVLRVDVWDEEATTVPPPFRFEGVQMADAGRFIGFGNDAWAGWYDRAECHLVVAVRAHARLSYVDRARPFSRLLLIWYADHGCVVLHSGLVARDNRGVLIVGAGRSGKSTTVLSCLADGFTALSDDCLALAPHPAHGFSAFSVYSALLVDPRAVHLFGAHGIPTDDDSRGRDLVYLRPGQAARSAPVTAMVLQRVVSDAASTLASVGRGEALRMLLPTALAMDSLGMATRRGFDALTALLDRVRCHRLLAGSDWRGIPRAVRLALHV